MIDKRFEAEFHDKRLMASDGQDLREEQSKYYWSVQRYADAFWREVLECSTGKEVLEIGCFSGIRAVEVAAVAKSVCAIDISPVAAEVTAERAAAAGRHNVVAMVCDAEHLSFPDCAFDVVFATGVIHHVDVGKTLKEIVRALKPGGKAIFREPLGHNPFINLYRRLTPNVRTPDEHPLTVDDINSIRSLPVDVRIKYCGFFSLMSTPFRRTVIGDYIRRATNTIDDIVFDNGFIGTYCWQANFTITKKSIVSPTPGGSQFGQEAT